MIRLENIVQHYGVRPVLAGIDPSRLIDHVERLLRLFELDEQGDWPIRSFSNGQQKKIALSAALATDARIMLLDEPFAGGLDPSGILALKQVLVRLVRDRGTTVVMSAPVPELVEELADRIVIVHHGRIAAFDTLDQLRKQAGCEGSLAEVYQRLVHPQSLDNIEAYFSGSGEEGR